MESKRVKDIKALKSGYTSWVRGFEFFSILAYTVMAVFTIYILRDYLVSNPLEVGLVMIAGWIASDFVTGVIHWVFDTWGKYDWPILGKLFVRPFLEHHISPNEITEHDWIETNGSNLFVGLLFLVGAYFFIESNAILTFFLCVSFWGSMTNQFHKWSHESEIPFYAVMLQKVGIILSKENHTRHHRDEFTEHYCITNGVMNRTLDNIGFFRLMEWIIQKIVGLKPRDNELP